MTGTVGTGAPAVELRGFQREILELAREKNVVMVGETGIGKTFLAIALLSEQDYSGGARAFFMAPTRQLVVQITAKIQQTSTLRVNAYCGRAADLWDAAQWERELQLTQVFVCTPEIVRNVLLKGYVGLDAMNLLVFDECHHVTKRHPYAQVIKMYNEADPATMPRIFGTTACPTRFCAEKLHAEMRKVELDHAQIAKYAASAPLLFETYPIQTEWGFNGGASSDTAQNGEDVFVAQDASWLYSHMEKELDEIKAIAVFEKLVKKGKSDAATDPTKLEKATKKFTQNCVTVYKNLGPWCYYRFVELEIHRLAIAASLLLTVPGSMYGLDKDAVKTILLLKAKLANCNFACTTKVQKVEELVRERLFIEDEDDVVDPSAGAGLDDEVSGSDENEEPTGEPSQDATSANVHGRLDLQGIVFVNTRTECRVLADFFNEKFAATSTDDAEDSDDEQESRYNVGSEEMIEEQPCACILGRASRSDTASFHLPKMEATLSKFESGAVRILISTAVSVEGVDFPQCGLIVVMDRVGTARMLTQLKGRARHEDGIVYYLAEEKDLGHQVYYQQLVREAEVINQLEFSRDKLETIQQQPRSVAAQKLGSDEYRIEIESTGAVLDVDSSIACVNQFCQSLPNKLFTVNVKKLYTVTEVRFASRTMFVAELNLPVELNLESFESDQMPSKAGARASAAFRACQKLLEEGLLDDSLNSIYRASKAKTMSSARDLSYVFDRLQV